jgi:hypothetical protein
MDPDPDPDLDLDPSITKQKKYHIMHRWNRPVHGEPSPVLWIRIRGEIMPDPGNFTQSKLSYPLCRGSAKINLKWNYPVDSELSTGRNPVLWIRIREKNIPDPVSSGSKMNLK